MSITSINNNKFRDPCVDVLKCIGIILVVIGHSNCPYIFHKMIYYVHMPLFFFLSGYTSKPSFYYSDINNVRTFLVKRIKSLYIPYLLFALPIVLLHPILYINGFYDSSFSSFKEYIFQIFRTLLLSVGEDEPLLPHLWFIKVLFIIEIGHAIVMHCIYIMKIPLKVYYWCLSIVFVSVFWINIKQAPHIFVMNLLVPIRAYLFYLLGMYFSNKSDYIRKKYGLLSVFFFLLAWPYVSHFTIRPVSIAEVTDYLSIAQILLTLLFIYSIMYIFHRFNLKLYLAQWVGRRTIFIYFSNYLIFKLITISYICITKDNSNGLYTPILLDTIPWWIYSVLDIVIAIILIHFYETVKSKILNYKNIKS